MNRLCKTAKYIRQELGLSLRDAADELEMLDIQVDRMETGHPDLPADLIVAYEAAMWKTWGIDLYIASGAYFTTDSDMDIVPVPERFRETVRILCGEWRDVIDQIIRDRRNPG